MVSGIREIDLIESNKGSGSKFHVGSRVCQETPEERGNIGLNDVNITIKTEAIVQKP